MQTGEALENWSERAFYFLGKETIEMGIPECFPTKYTTEQHKAQKLVGSLTHIL